MKVMRVINQKGKLFNIVLLLPGETWGDLQSIPKKSFMVYFFDAEYNGLEFERVGKGFGQFTGGSYYLETLMESEAGLNLHGGVKGWSLDAGTMKKVRSWVSEQVQMVIDQSVGIESFGGPA